MLWAERPDGQRLIKSARRDRRDLEGSGRDYGDEYPDRQCGATRLKLGVALEHLCRSDLRACHVRSYRHLGAHRRPRR